MSAIIYNRDDIDFDKPGKAVYKVAFHYDGEWGYALVPMAVINGKQPDKQNVVAFGGTLSLGTETYYRVKGKRFLEAVVGAVTNTLVEFYK